jgi:hypothetical protein
VYNSSEHETYDVSNSSPENHILFNVQDIMLLSQAAMLINVDAA